MTVPMAPDERRTIFGALDYASGQVCWQMHAAKGGAAFAAFLAHIAKTWPDEQIVLVMDNASYHRSPAVRAWWSAQQGRITPFWLPVYAPQLNLIERVWGFVKQKLACHRFWGDIEGLGAAATVLLDRLEARFHTDTSPAIRLV